MKSFRLLMLVVLFVWMSSGVRGWSETLCIDTDRQFAYASDLLAGKDYATARVEYSRFIRFFPDDPRVGEARFRIAMAFFEEGNPRQALAGFEALVNDEASGIWSVESVFMAAQCHLQTGNSVLGEIGLRNLLALSPDSDVRDRVHNSQAWLRLETGQWDSARTALDQLSVEGRHLYQADAIAAGLSNTPDIPQKNPTLAGTLSIVPGAGFLYCGRYTDALVAFLLNGGLILAAHESFDHDLNALGGVITFVGFGFYAGNIYGAASSAHKYNRQANRDFISRLKQTLSPSLTLMPDSDTGLKPALVLEGRF